MEKVIAIMDKPIDCQDCPFGMCKYSLPLTTNKVGYVCTLHEDRVVKEFNYAEEIHLTNCPLKPIPKKKDICGTYNNEYYANGGMSPSEKIGYNTCIDEILTEYNGVITE